MAGESHSFVVFRPPLPESSLEKMKRFKRRLSQTLRGSHTIDESLSELAEQMTIEENGLKDSGAFILSCRWLPHTTGVRAEN